MAVAVGIAALALATVAGPPADAHGDTAAGHVGPDHGDFASAATDPYVTDEIVREIVFPVLGDVHYVDTFLAPRGGDRLHLGVDLMGTKGDLLVAATDSCVTWLRHAGEGSESANLVILTDEDGWEYWYIHLNNDTPGTDDHANRYDEAFYDGIEEGVCVEAGDPVGFLGDSGAEWAGAHLHLEIRRPDAAINPYHSVVAAEAGRRCGPNEMPAAAAAGESARGLWVLTDSGRVIGLDAPHLGDLVTEGVDVPPVALSSTPTGEGYLIVDEDGVVHAFGDAESVGDMSDHPLNGPVLGLEPVVDGTGYWLVASDGGVFGFDAPFMGSMGDQRLNAPIIAMAATPEAGGYWLIGRDGGVFSFGDAEFHGSTGDMALAAPIISMAAHPDGDGYWLYARDGGVFAFDVDFHGSVPGIGLCSIPETVALRVSDTGEGYWLAAADGRVFSFGDALETDGIDPAELGADRVIDLAVRHHGPSD